MRKIISFVFALATFVAASAQNTVNLGYCNGEVATSSEQVLNSTGWVHAAISLPPTATSAYNGSSLTAVRVALVQRINIDTLKVWVRTHLDGENLAEGVITRTSSPKIARGWNTAQLDKPVSINGRQLYVGFSFKQRASVQGVSLVGEPMYNTSYVKLGDADWQDISQLGQVSIEAVVQGSTVPAFDLGLTGAVVSPYPTAGPNALRVTAQVHNFGMNDAHALRFALLSGPTELEAQVPDTVLSARSKAVTFVVNPSQAIESEQFTLCLRHVDGFDDEVSANDSIEASYAYLKNVLVEEFTTEKCVSCPRVANLLNAVLEEAPYRDRVAAVCHHAGYYTDQFTQSWDEDLVWLYATSDKSYAPAVLVDRRPDFSNSNDRTPTAFIPQSTDEMKQVLDYYMDRVAELAVGVSVTLNADSTYATVAVNGKKSANYATKNPRLTVYLVENGIATTSQTGATGTFVQNHVTRAQNSTWGVPVEWNGNTFSYECSLSIDKSWKRENMQAVAFVGNYDADDKENCVIDNASAVSLLDKSSATGIKDLSTAAKGTETWYNLSGMRLREWQRGINIVRTAHGRVVKVLRR